MNQLKKIIFLIFREKNSTYGYGYDYYFKLSSFLDVAF